MSIYFTENINIALFLPLPNVAIVHPGVTKDTCLASNISVG